MLMGRERDRVGHENMRTIYATEIYLTRLKEFCNAKHNVDGVDWGWWYLGKLWYRWWLINLVNG